MPLQLNTVSAYLKDVRTLLLDRTKPYRYSDISLVAALNLALLETRRLRPDLFVTRYGNEVPSFDDADGQEVPIEAQFRIGIVYGICAHALLRDEEDVQDARANSFLEKFHDILVGVRPSPVQGGTPAPQKKAGG